MKPQESLMRIANSVSHSNISLPSQLLTVNPLGQNSHHKVNREKFELLSLTPKELKKAIVWYNERQNWQFALAIMGSNGSRSV